MARQHEERTPLLQNRHNESGGAVKVQFNSDGDEGNPREWSLSRKSFQVAQIFILSLMCLMTSSIFAPALDQMSETFGSSKQIVLLGQTTFMFGLGTGPLFLAPMSETFGRRPLFVVCLIAFTLLQIPTALSPSVAVFIPVRMLAGFVGSVGVANGGGSIFDMFDTHERAMVLGVYLVAPIFGPTLGPLVGGLILGRFDWRCIFWFTLAISTVVTTIIGFCLSETNATTILQARRKSLQSEHPRRIYEVDGASDSSIPQKILQNSTRAIRILVTQPIVAIMSLYQALVFASLYSLYAQYETIWARPPYNFNKTEVGLAFLGPATGFILVSAICVVFIDRVYNYFTKLNNDDGLPEYRLPLANIGAIFLPVSLFWFGWTIENQYPWPIPFVATIFFGASQVAVFNPVQTYYIDAYGPLAASALAAGALLRSFLGGVVPLFVGQLFDNLGYGWGTSIFGFLSILLMPAPLLFQKYGRHLREKFSFQP